MNVWTEGWKRITIQSSASLPLLPWWVVRRGFYIVEGKKLCRSLRAVAESGQLSYLWWAVNTITAIVSFTTTVYRTISHQLKASTQLHQSYVTSLPNTMSPQLSHEALGQAVVQAVQHGTFPQSEDVASAPVPAEAFPKLLEEINNAQEGIKVRTFREITRIYIAHAALSKRSAH